MNRHSIHYCMVLLSVSIMLTSCSDISSAMTSQPSCDQLHRQINDQKFVMEITNWADQEVLHRKFSSENYRVGDFSGPGLRTSTLDTQRASINAPSWLGKHEIRVIDDPDDIAKLIFVGVGRYRGYLVGEREISTYSDNKRIAVEKIISNGRAGIICYEEKL